MNFLHRHCQKEIEELKKELSTISKNTIVAGGSGNFCLDCINKEIKRLTKETITTYKYPKSFNFPHCCDHFKQECKKCFMDKK